MFFSIRLWARVLSSASRRVGQGVCPVFRRAVPVQIRAHARRCRVVRVGFQALCQAGGEVVQSVCVLFHGLNHGRIDRKNRHGRSRRVWGRA